jgi:hypothetical protein
MTSEGYVNETCPVEMQAISLKDVMFMSVRSEAPFLCLVTKEMVI